MYFVGVKEEPESNSWTLTAARTMSDAITQAQSCVGLYGARRVTIFVKVSFTATVDVCLVHPDFWGVDKKGRLKE